MPNCDFYATPQDHGPLPNAPKNGHLGSSHTNHNSQKRAENWAPAVGVKPGPDAWDFQRINAFSSRLNRQIRKQSVGKLGSRPVLPGAVQLWEQGMSLSPYLPDQDVLEVGK